MFDLGDSGLRKKEKEGGGERGREGEPEGKEKEKEGKVFDYE